MAKSGMERRGGAEGRRGDPEERKRPPFPWDRRAAKARHDGAETGVEPSALSQLGRDNRLEIPAQPIDIMDSAPGNPTAAEALGGADAERGRLQPPSAPRDDGAETGVEPGALALLGRDNRPEIPAQPIDIMDSAPGNPIAAEGPGGADAERGRLQPPSAARDDGAETGVEPSALALLGRDNRPEIPAQPTDIMESAPGNPIAAEAPGRRGRGARASSTPLGGSRRRRGDWRGTRRPGPARARQSPGNSSATH